jgi:hypothetical protein
VARVAVALRRVEHPGHGVLEAEVLPAREAAGHGRDVRVPQLLERLGRERAPDSAGAVDDHLGILVGQHVLDPALEMAPGDVASSRHEAVLDLLVLAHVEDEEPVAPPEALVDVLGRDFLDLGFDLLQQVTEVSHCLILSAGLVYRVRPAPVETAAFTPYNSRKGC